MEREGREREGKGLGRELRGRRQGEHVKQTKTRLNLQLQVLSYSLKLCARGWII